MRSYVCAIIFTGILLTISVGRYVFGAETSGEDYAGERIVYSIKPFGRAQYVNSGLADLNGEKVIVITIDMRALVFSDTERIYIDPETFLVRKIERYLTKLWWKEYITEEYDQEKFLVTIKLFRKGVFVCQQIIKKKGPVHNAMLLPFYLSRCPNPDLNVRWSFIGRFPGEFKLQLVSTQAIRVPAGRFQAYHYKSVPKQFEIWMNKENPRVPLKIKGSNPFRYIFLMQKYRFH